MRTPPKELSLENAGEPLVRSRQKLGILPTLSFWNRPENWRPVRYPMAGFAGATVLVAYAIDLPPILGGLAIGTTVFLGIGVMERAVRSAIAGRRAHYEELEQRLLVEEPGEDGHR